ncbi:MAG: F0F1 ATP synthase subunit epsilon [Terriglobia bacterium]
MPDTIELQVVTAQRQLVREAVDEVQVPGRDGYLGILPGHAPLLSELQAGELSYRKGTQRSFLSVFWGFVEVLSDRVTVLAETAERAEEIDLNRAREAQRRAEQRLAHPDDSALDLARAQAALQRALIRMQVAGKTARVGAGRPGRASGRPTRSR